MIQIKAIAYPPDPIVPSVIAGSSRWVGWGGTSQSRQAMQTRIADAIGIYGPRGVVPVTAHVDLPSPTIKAHWARLTVENIEKDGFQVLNLVFCTTAVYDWVAEQVEIASGAKLRDALTKRPKFVIEKFFAARKLRNVELLLWHAKPETAPSAVYGALRSDKHVAQIIPEGTPRYRIAT